MKKLNKILKNISTEDILNYIYEHRSDVSIIQYYSIDHIKEISGINASNDIIKDHWDSITDYLHSDWIMEKCNDHLKDMRHCSEDWGLEELFLD
jgi:hypothetical protein